MSSLEQRRESPRRPQPSRLKDMIGVTLLTAAILFIEFLYYLSGAGQ